MSERTKQIMETLRQRCIERMNACSEKGRGKKRDDAVLDFYCGAANALYLANDIESGRAIESYLSLVLCVRGYQALIQDAPNAPMTTAA